jgi:uncharacterized protein (TIGR02466 family)
MSVTKHEWWVTPIWEIDTEFNEEFNQLLLKEISMCKQIPGHMFNIWDYTTPAINTLKHKIISSAREHASEYFPKSFGYNPDVTRGWVNRQMPGDELALHDHGGSLLSATYYITAPEKSGDLKMVDPRGGVNWEWIQEGNISGIKYKRITPVAGKLVLFPSYVMHMVETNRSHEVRISLATNIYNKR